MRPYGECVYFAFHQLTKRGIYHTVTHNRIFAGKLRGDDVQYIMPATASGTWMSGMFVAFIGNFD